MLPKISPILAQKGPRSLACGLGKTVCLDPTSASQGQVWGGFLTYLETEDGFCYLALVPDIFSRFIVGFDVSTSLAVEGALAALNLAIS